MKNPYNSITLEVKIVVTLIGLALIIAALWDYFGVSSPEKTECEKGNEDFMEIIMVAKNGSGEYKTICLEKTEIEKEIKIEV